MFSPMGASYRLLAIYVGYGCQRLFRPYRAWFSCWRRTQGDASHYPGLSHFAPLGLWKGCLFTRAYLGRSRQIAVSPWENRMHPGSSRYHPPTIRHPKFGKSNPGPLPRNCVPNPPFRCPNGAAHDSPGQARGWCHHENQPCRGIIWKTPVPGSKI